MSKTLSSFPLAPLKSPVPDVMVYAAGPFPEAKIFPSRRLALLALHASPLLNFRSISQSHLGASPLEGRSQFDLRVISQMVLPEVENGTLVALVYLLLKLLPPVGLRLNCPSETHSSARTRTVPTLARIKDNEMELMSFILMADNVPFFGEILKL